jgi:hypothetical protein
VIGSCWPETWSVTHASQAYPWRTPHTSGDCEVLEEGRLACALLEAAA